MERMKAIIALADGLVLRGGLIGKPGTTGGELVFNTSMTGYQEILTDPSYAGEIVTFTFPLIGNYGWTAHDDQSLAIFASGIVVSSLSDSTDNWMATVSLPDRLARDDKRGIEGVDTRIITQHLRTVGAMNAIVTTELSETEALNAARDWLDLSEQDLVGAVTCGEGYDWTEKSANVEPICAEPRFRIAAFDCGIKRGILRALAARCAEIRVFPATTSASGVRAWNPDGVFLSNGPGDPKACIGYLRETILDLVQDLPTMGICLGHQLLGLCFGLDTYKLKFGHRGANHPIKDLVSGRVHITSQNHGYAVEHPDDGHDLVLTHLNVNDGSVEGFRHKSLPIFSVQYHPEGCPGPRDNLYLFDEFIAMLEHAKS
jgi:carbamoyl-phosphate synthase small subunit